ncbi:hypothetical protein ACKC5O_21045, partial [Aeromonas schubertii]|uniref:hypothetical protein n=1 Tax=Aeromonas schubertii TaxID=652 RepID=UPI0038B4B41A
IEPSVAEQPRFPDKMGRSIEIRNNSFPGKCFKSLDFALGIRRADCLCFFHYCRPDRMFAPAFE